MRFSFRIKDKVIHYGEYMTFSNVFGGWVYKDGNRDKMITKRFPHLVDEYHNDLKTKEERTNREADLARLGQKK